MKFYRKLSPQTTVPITIPGQPAKHLRFPSNDNAVGWFATDNAQIQNCLTDHIQNNRCGISEVTWEQFEAEYVKKKPAQPQSRKPWREEVSMGAIRRLASAKAAPASPVAVVTDASGLRMEDLPPSAPPTANGQPATPDQPQNFTPTVGRRGSIT